MQKSAWVIVGVYALAAVLLVVVAVAGNGLGSTVPAVFALVMGGAAILFKQVAKGGTNV